MAMIASSDELLNASQIAKDLGFSRNHLAKVLQLLARHNYLDSTRGPSGGFRLKSDPSKISLLEIYELVEGEVEKNHCMHNFENCLFEECVYGKLGTKFTRKFKEYFGGRKLSDVKIKPKKNQKQNDPGNY